MLRRIAIGLVLALLVALPVSAWADFEQDKQHCVRDPNPDIKIGGCTRLIQSGRFDNNNLAHIFYNRGIAHASKRQYDRAIRDFNEAIRLKPYYADAFYNRGNAYARKGQYDRAIGDYTDHIRLKPDHAKAFYNRGIAHASKRQYDRAIRDFGEALRLKPDFAFAFYNRGTAYSDKRQYDRAIQDYTEAIRLKPDYAKAFNIKAWILATAREGRYRNGAEAVRLAKRAVSLKNHVNYVDTLAAAYAEAGDYSAAVRTQERAIEMLRRQGKQSEIADYETRLSLYKRGKPYRK